MQFPCQHEKSGSGRTAALHPIADVLDDLKGAAAAFAVGRMRQRDENEMQLALEIDHRETRSTLSQKRANAVGRIAAQQ
jgi:hypothetical protein